MEFYATQHEDICHNPTKDERGFFKINIVELLSGFRQQINAPNGAFMVAIEYDFRMTEQVSDMPMKRATCGFIIAAHHKKQDADDMKAKMTLCENICTDILNRMRDDSRNEVNDINSLFFGQMDCFNDIKLDSVKEIGDINNSGFMCTFFLEAPHDCTVEEAKWKDLP